MIYKQQKPVEALSNIVKSYWMIDSIGDSTVKKEKIIPDGYPEMIFHYEEPYRTNINGEWMDQEKDLIAGQISNYFYLENIGRTGMFAIKLQPWALNTLFDIDMSKITNRVVPIKDHLLKEMLSIKQIAIRNDTFLDKISAIEEYLLNNFDVVCDNNDKYQSAVRLIINSKGKMFLSDILDQIRISERSLERYFKTHIGLTPKLYSRVIRFSNIFQLLNDEDFSWSDVTYLAGFYDQSHFIKNFKEFTGEEPSKYGFTQENMANFFLRK